MQEAAMRPILCINDLHLGAVRSGGTTMLTALQLRQELLFGFQQLLDMAGDDDVIINGDLFDTAAVPLTDLYAAISIADSWLARGTARLILPPGNHDLSKNRETFSSFDFFANYLRGRYGDRVLVPREFTWIGDGVAVIPHMPNQDLFELELSKVVKQGCETLFLHCNFDSGFAAKSDHSLNLSRDQAETLDVTQIVIAHEHQAKRVALNSGTMVYVVGNQMPSSVADCLGNDTKFACGLEDGLIEMSPTWHAEGNFTQMDWRTLADDGAQFIRVIGDAQSDEASAVVQAIAKFRQQSKALVITNAVQIAGSSTAEMTVSLEQVQNFNVMEELMKFMETDEQRAMIAKLMESSDV